MTERFNVNDAVDTIFGAIAEGMSEQIPLSLFVNESFKKYMTQAEILEVVHACDARLASMKANADRLEPILKSLKN